MSSAKANGVEPFDWLRDLFTCLPDYRQGEAFQQAAERAPVTSTELDEFLPDKWLEQHPEHTWTIDRIHRDERRSKER